MAAPPTLGPPASAPSVRVPLCVVVNGNASGANVTRRVDRLLAGLRAEGADVELVHTSAPADLAAVWATAGARRLVLVGGDGGIHAAANVGGPPRDIALIPAGRANNVARSLGIPLDWTQAARLAAHGQVRPIDVIEARAGDRTRFVVEGVSVGFLAQARVRYRGRNSADLRAGLRAGMAALAHFHPMAVRVAGPDGAELLHISQLLVANLPLYEFGLRVAPRADPTDATLDLVAIDAPSRRAVLRMIVDLRRGTHLRRPNVHAWRAPEVTIETNGCSPVVAASTDLGPGAVVLRPVPAALRLVRP
jgi:diacylglycerol kinase family enzyme